MSSFLVQKMKTCRTCGKKSADVRSVTVCSDGLKRDECLDCSPTYPDCACCGKSNEWVRLVGLGYGGLMRPECTTCCPSQPKHNANALWMCQRCGQLRKDVRTVGLADGEMFAHACKSCCPTEKVLRELEDPTEMPAMVLEAQHKQARKDYFAWLQRPQTIEERITALEERFVVLEGTTLPALLEEAMDGVGCDGHDSNPLDIDEEDFKELELKVKNMERSWNTKLKRLASKLDYQPPRRRAAKKVL